MSFFHFLLTKNVIYFTRLLNLQPDISAPGVEILAAYSPAASPSGLPSLDTRSVEYNVLSGTSMACPHVTAAAAYVKSLHPSWSPSAIKSALMTTGNTLSKGACSSTFNILMSQLLNSYISFFFFLWVLFNGVMGMVE